MISGPLLNASTVLHHAASLSGQPVNEDEGIDRDTHSMLTSALNARLQVIWRADVWPDVTRTEERRKSYFYSRTARFFAPLVIVWRKDRRAYLVVADFTAGPGAQPDDPTLCAPLPPPELVDDIVDEGIYNAGDWVYNTQTNVVTYCRQNNTTGYEHADATKFVPLPATYFPEFESQNLMQPVMGDVLRVTDRSPNGNEDEEDLPFILTDLGVRVQGDPGMAWMQYRLPVPPISGDPWDDGHAYTAPLYRPPLVVERPQVYYEADLVGNYYDVLASTLPGESPDTTPAKFQRVEIPALFGTWLAFALAADWLRMDGQTDKAGDREASATMEMARLKDNLHRQQRQVTCLPVLSRC